MCLIKLWYINKVYNIPAALANSVSLFMFSSLNAFANCCIGETDIMMYYNAFKSIVRVEGMSQQRRKLEFGDGFWKTNGEALRQYVIIHCLNKFINKTGEMHTSFTLSILAERS